MLSLQRADNKAILLELNNILCFAVIRNESLRLPFFLKYYREKGIDKFFIVDNDSDDETLSYLLQQPDTYVWHTKDSFKNKLVWLEWLLKSYGNNHWCLMADADEILYYPDCETKLIKDLCRQLDRQKKDALKVLMLDMYSDKPIREVQYQQGTHFLEACPYFDRKFYHHKEGLRHDYYWGGLRERVFGTITNASSKKLYCLTKFPLIKYNSKMQLYSDHMIKNIKCSSTTGCFLHFKYLSSFVNYVNQEIQRKQHWQGAIEYKKYAQALEEDEKLNFYNEKLSLRLVNSRKLIAMGIIKRGHQHWLGEVVYDLYVLVRALGKALSKKIIMSKMKIGNM
ncbi:MAG TPA: hypothetical protein DDZ80_30065 [Cyanobacteria bacterium UBA8803]|nr:hypothetical protein [Cyanobacteria bacterium UBA9273]HBL62482.1 hypothetical protein [Cyanobacteria bacterium UBA8803]